LPHLSVGGRFAYVAHSDSDAISTGCDCKHRPLMGHDESVILNPLKKEGEKRKVSLVHRFQT